MSRLEQQMEFIIEIDKLKNILRQNYIADGSRRESDTDHSWHIAVMCFILAEHANEEINVEKTMKMLLIHDLVEIDAGDTYAYDKEANGDKREREVRAADRIFNLLPEDQAEKMRNLWEEFEEGKTPEAKFANTLDKVQPAMLNDRAGGKSWEEHGVEYSQVLERNKDTAAGSQILWDYTEEILNENVRNGKIKK